MGVMTVVNVMVVGGEYGVSRWVRVRRFVAAVAIIATAASLSIASPAVAAPTVAETEPSAPPAPSSRDASSDDSVDPARVPVGDGIEPSAVAANFNPGYIISDYAMFNGAAMTQDEIQAFLDEKIGVCLNGKCLNVLSVPTRSRVADPMCSAYSGSASESIARIIFKVQVACGVSAKVILVTLQKEQGLITDKAPTDTELRKAMGYSCPDTAPCNPSFAGIADQLYWGARAFDRYTMPPGTGPGTPFFTNFNWFPVGRPLAVQYHPNSACGSKTITIRNKATASLYYYTPYQPNAAALANLYGTGNSCSSYGNRNFWRLYTDWFGSPTTLVPDGVTVERLQGSDRFATAVRVSETAYPDGAPIVYLATGANFPDGLAAAAAAASEGGPLLMVSRTAVSTVVRAELTRLNPSRIVIVGSEAVVGKAVDDVVRSLLPEVEIDRFFGSNRYETALDIARQGFETASIAFIATGENFPDALAASAAAGHLGGPVLLVPRRLTQLDEATVAELTRLGVTTVVIAGGPAAVSEELEASLASVPGVTTVERRSGRDRFATAASLNEYAFTESDVGYVASGMNFPDALGAAAAAGAFNAPLHLSNGVCTHTPSLQHLVDARVGTVRFIGSTAVLRSTVAEFLTCG